MSFSAGPGDDGHDPEDLGGPVSAPVELVRVRDVEQKWQDRDTQLEHEDRPRVLFLPFRLVVLREDSLGSPAGHRMVHGRRGAEGSELPVMTTNMRTWTTWSRGEICSYYRGRIRSQGWKLGTCRSNAWNYDCAYSWSMGQNVSDCWTFSDLLIINARRISRR